MNKMGRELKLVCKVSIPHPSLNISHKRRYCEELTVKESHMSLVSAITSRKMSHFLVASMRSIGCLFL